MKNGEVYETENERIVAFNAWWAKFGCHYGISMETAIFRWINMTAEEPKPDRCPFCGQPTHLEKGRKAWNSMWVTSYSVACDCGYRSQSCVYRDEAIIKHNRTVQKMKTKGES